MRIYIVMGVSGVGKTTVGKLLSGKLHLPFFDADNFHPFRNVKKMKKGLPLQDEDRRGWLKELAKNIEHWHKKEGAVLACSALKEQYRAQLQSVSSKDMVWIFLHAEYDVILNRLKSRKDHYFKPELLQSQFDTLEVPGSGIHINVNASVEKIIDEIMVKIKNRDKKSQIGLVGLGVMGKSLALNMASKSVRVAVFNRHLENQEVDIAKNFAELHNELYDFPWFDDIKAFITSLERPRNILLMVKAGKTVDLVIKSLLPLLDKNDLIIDGGNSNYKDSIKREKNLRKKGVLFIGVGISGGEEGARKGPSIMPGGSTKSYERVGGILEKIAAKDKEERPCCTYIGPDGAGHFVKMLHNGIEYGEMQLIAEIYHYLRFFTHCNTSQIAEIFEQWNMKMQSYLLEISIDILRKKEESEFLIDKIMDAAKQKGTGGWSTNTAIELGVPFDTISAALMARNISAKKKERMTADTLYNFISTPEKDQLVDLEKVFSAYQAGSIINHAIGFDLLKEASKEYNWNLNLSEIARIWTNGCIIRSQFMEELIEIFEEIPTKNLLIHPKIIFWIRQSKDNLTNFIGEALNTGCPLPVLSAAANYLLSYTSGQSSANMIQAQRDYFGAHTYKRKDKPMRESFHTQWKK